MYSLFVTKIDNRWSVSIGTIENPYDWITLRTFSMKTSAIEFASNLTNLEINVADVQNA